MDFNTHLFLLTSLLVVIDFGLAGLRLFQLSRRSKPDERPFVAGIAWLMMTVAIFNLFWIILIVFGSRLRLSENLVTRHIATALIISIDLAAMTGLHRWWNRIIPAVKNGHHNEEVPHNETP